MARQLIVRGFLFPDSESYGALRLTESARMILKGEKNLNLREDVKAIKPSKDSKPSSSPRSKDPLSETDIPLWDALRACRKQIAEEQGIPPYMVFHDSTLKEIAEQRPSSERAMLGVNGIGQVKLERFGHAFLQVVREYSQ